MKCFRGIFCRKKSGWYNTLRSSGDGSNNSHSSSCFPLPLVLEKHGTVFKSSLCSCLQVWSHLQSTFWGLFSFRQYVYADWLQVKRDHLGTKSRFPECKPLNLRVTTWFSTFSRYKGGATCSFLYCFHGLPLLYCLYWHSQQSELPFWIIKSNLNLSSSII